MRTLDFEDFIMQSFARLYVNIFQSFFIKRHFNDYRAKDLISFQLHAFVHSHGVECTLISNNRYR